MSPYAFLFFLNINFFCEQCIYYISFLHRSVSDDFEVAFGVLLDFECSFVLITPNSQGWPCHPFFFGWYDQSLLLVVCGTNDFTDSRVGDAGVTRSSPMWGSSSTSGLPHL